MSLKLKLSPTGPPPHPRKGHGSILWGAYSVFHDTPGPYSGTGQLFCAGGIDREQRTGQEGGSSWIDQKRVEYSAPLDYTGLRPFTLLSESLQGPQCCNKIDHGDLLFY